MYWHGRYIGHKGEGLTEGVRGPGVPLLQGQSLPSNFLPPVFVVGLLQTEGKAGREEEGREEGRCIHGSLEQHSCLTRPVGRDRMACPGSSEA